MRRIDAIAIALGVFLAGGLVYFALQIAGFDNIDAGIWTQTFLVIGLVGWSLTYLIRVGTKNMTYNKQLKDYEDAVLQKRLEEMSPEELAQLEAEIAAERSQSERTD
jgi:hypothetical protein